MVVDWPEGWEAPTYEDADTGDGVDLRSDAMELAFQAMRQLVRSKLGPCPPHTAEELAELRVKMIAFGMDPDDPDGPLARLKATPGRG